MGFFLNISWTLQKQEIDCSYYFPDCLSSTSQLLSVLLASEEEIQTRSKAIESHWSPDKYQDKSSGKNEFSSFKVHLTLYNKCTPNSKWFGKKPCTHSGLEKNLEFQLILYLGKQLSNSFCLSRQQHVHVLACLNYWLNWKMTSFNPVANQACEFQNYWSSKKISSSRTTGLDVFKLCTMHTDHYTKLHTSPSPKPTFCPKWEVSVNVHLGEG